MRFLRIMLLASILLLCLSSIVVLHRPPSIALHRDSQGFPALDNRFIFL